MVTSATPNKRTTASKKSVSSEPTAAKSWKQKAVGGTLVTVPSGNTALVRTPGMQAFLQNGIVPNGLMPFIQEAMEAGEAPDDGSVQDWMKDPTKIQEIMDMADAVTVYCCIEPKVEEAPTELVDGEHKVIPIGDERRDDDILYVDEVDLNDKMFIFNFVVGGSTAALEKFRTE
jgi:hypothetical protein